MIGILILAATIVGIWKVWGILFEGDKVEPFKSARKKLEDWREETKEILRQPGLSKEQIEKAVLDLEMYDNLIKALE